MILIAHRGNLDGPKPKYENTIAYVSRALDLGFDVEVDVWKMEGENFFRLGHDKPILNETLPTRFFQDKRVWAHCKNDAAYSALRNDKIVNCFVQENESLVMTSRSYKWFHSGYKGGHKGGIVVDLSQICTSVYIEGLKKKGVLGVCTDYPLHVISEISERGA